MRGKKVTICSLLLVACGLIILFFATYAQLLPVEITFRNALRITNQSRIIDRNGIPLTISYSTTWNTNNHHNLHEIPKHLVDAFVLSEDKRFFKHSGIDLKARLNAIYDTLISRRVTRGASTITEQVVRMLHPRPRRLWSKWLEGFEAMRLEQFYSKQQIIEFYLNQLPYVANRRGIAQAARYYFDRELDTLSIKEMIALIVLVRAPSSYDLYRHSERITLPVKSLAKLLYKNNIIDQYEYETINKQHLVLRKPSEPINAEHFVKHLRNQPLLTNANEVRASLDASLQNKTQRILDSRLMQLTAKNVNNAALLIADHQSNEILAWVVGGAGKATTPAAKVDAVTVARQPGSALKPFLYAAALERGWTAATIIIDEPFSGAVNTGQHYFKNYSNTFYQAVTLREALGSSLNIPAVKTIRHVGPTNYLNILHTAGFNSLTKSANIYDDGLALGSGEVSLLELVQGYAILARAGIHQPLKVTLDSDIPDKRVRIFSPEAATLIADILSDPQARALEFGNASVLNLPLQTAIKTGTSTDYRDAWAAGFNDRYVVGVWMGNLNYQPTEGMTGATGPALVLRSIFAELNKHRTTRRLQLSPQLARKEVCLPNPLNNTSSECVKKSELFMPGNPDLGEAAIRDSERIVILQPTARLNLAIDPRTPINSQYYTFQMTGKQPNDRVEWFINNKSLGTPMESKEKLWQLEKGRHKLYIKVYSHSGKISTTNNVNFVVK